VACIRCARPAVSASDGARRFALEAQLVAGLSHPNVVAVHDFGSDRGSFGASMSADGSSRRRPSCTANR